MSLFRSAALLSCCAAVLFQTARPCAQVSENGAHTAPNTAAAEFRQAKELLSTGSLDLALAAVQRGLARSPRSVEGLNLLGIIYQQQQRFADAGNAFEKALAINPRSLETLNNLANSYTVQRNFDIAQRTLRKILRLDPGNRTANYNFGLLLLSEGKPKEAIAMLERVRPPDSSTLLSLVQAYLMAGRTSRGVRTARNLSARAGKDVKLHFSLGVMLAGQKEYGSAIREFELANALQPRTPEILHDLAVAYLRNREPAKAQVVLEEARKLQPGSAQTLLLLAETEAAQQKDVEALELLAQARNLDSQNTDVLLLMARLSMKQSFYEDAIELLNSAVRTNPRNAELHAALGESYFTVGQVDKALEEFKTLLQLDPSAQSYAYMGLCQRHLGRFEQAKQLLSNGLGKDPNDPLILFNLGFIARRQGDTPHAQQYLARAVQRDPDYPDALLELGTLKMDQKKYEEAIPLLRRCAKVSRSPAQAYYKLAIAERNLQRTAASQRDMKVFETLSKDPEPAPYPLQHFFEYLDRRQALSPEQRVTVDVTELEAEARQHPDRPRTWYLLAEAYLKLGRVSDAMKTIEHLDALSGGDSRTALEEGVLLARFRLYPASIQHLQSAVAADPASNEARYNLANAYFQNHDYEQALRSLQQVSAEGQKDEAWLALMGDTELRLGHTAVALEALRQAVASSPDNDQYYLLLALAQMRDGDLGQAGTSLQQGLARVPDSGILHWGLGVLSVLRGEAQRAETYLKKAVELMPSRESAYATLGIFYYEAGRMADARQVLQQYSQMFPEPSIDVARIRQTLDATPAQPSKKQPNALSADARREFYQLALALAEAER